MKRCRKVRVTKSGWSYWQKPRMKGYLMQCCDCGLIHEVEFRVYRIIERHSNGTKTMEMAGEDYEVGIRMRREERREEMTNQEHLDKIYKTGQDRDAG